MQIKMNRVKDQLITVFRDGSELLWDYSSWARLNAREEDGIFGPTNDLLRSLTSPELDFIEAQFKEAHAISQEAKNHRELKDGLTPVVANIINSFNFEVVREWSERYAKFVMPEDAMTTYNDKHPRETTYLLAEIYDLHVMATIIKVVTPICGSFMCDVAPALGKNYKEIKALDLFNQCHITTTKPWQQISTYAYKLATHKTIPSMAINLGLTSDLMPRYALAMAVMRRILIATLRGPEYTSIIQYLYKFLTNQASQQATNDFRDKGIGAATDMDGEDESVADKYRIAQSVPLSVPVMSEVFVDNTKVFAKSLPVPVELEILEKNIKEINDNPYFVIHEVHIMLCAHVVQDVVHPKTLQLMNRDSMVSIIAASAEVFKQAGYMGLSELMMATRAEREPTVLNVSTVGGRVYKKLPPPIHKELSELYKYVKESTRNAKTTNPGSNFIETVVKSLISHDWHGFNQHEDIRQEIATLLLKGYK